MNRMVNSALTYIRDGLETEQAVPIDLPALLRTVSDNFIDVGENVTYEGTERLSIRAQPDAMVRAVENLIENALKYGVPPRGPDTLEPSVEVEVRMQRDQARFSVRDRGEGVAAEHLPRLTERFYRIDAGQSRAKGGTGLGLALVKHIVAHHRGRLEIDSVVGEGSTFTVTLPVLDECGSGAGAKRAPVA
jgi:two-component system phosphate regulon sensor histidine kinase PhoR